MNWLDGYEMVMDNISMSRWISVTIDSPQGPKGCWYQCCLIPLLLTMTVVLSTFSENFQMTPRWVLQLICLRDRMPSRGTLISWKSIYMGTSWASTNLVQGPSGSGKFPVPVLGMKRLTAALRRRTWGYWWMKDQTWSGNVHLHVLYGTEKNSEK